MFRSRGWARANGFGGYTLNRGGQIILTNRTSRLVFDTDSADSQINGVNVRLSHPVAKGALISQLDVDKTIRPLIFPPKACRQKNLHHLPRSRPRRARTPATASAGFFRATKKPTRWRWRLNCATS